MALVIDGVFFQLAQSGIARIWRAVLPLLAKNVDMPVIFLDRGGFDEQFENIEVVPFPSYKSKYNAGDSQLLEQVCRHYGAKVFTSTYYSTPMETPSLLLVYDMIPERLGFDLSARDWLEKELAIIHARRHLCISGNTRKDLLEFYPELDPRNASFAYCGVDSAFTARDERAVAEFKRKMGLHRPYFMFVGSRVQANNYKNASLFFDTLSQLQGVDFDVLCVGGEKDTSGAATTHESGARIIQVDLDDDGLALAYGGAAALVYPSLYEGFGLPVAEAMSCRCPVICTAHGSLAEVGGGSTLQISGASTQEMASALQQVRDPDVRQPLIERGSAQATKFRWEPFVDEMVNHIHSIAAENERGVHQDFYRRWAQIRRLQGNVDVLV